jgi:hypothetical protein
MEMCNEFGYVLKSQGLMKGLGGVHDMAKASRQ